jgi:CelD/BcsL family acetyltransferase involved in cellulose biosynthesis
VATSPTTTGHTSIVDPIADLAWRSFIERSNQGSIFHHPSWMGMLRDQYGYDFYACCVRDDNDSIIAGLPLGKVRSWITGTRLVALPFSDICPPLFDDGSAAATALARALEHERGRSGLDIEVRGELAALRSAFAERRFLHHLIRLDPDVRAVEANFAKSQRSTISKARREGLIAERRTDPEALEIFYGLHARTRARQGVPTQPKRFIARIERLFVEGLGFVLLVRDGAIPIAAAVFLTFKRTITYKYSASDIRHLDKRPNNLLFMEAITWACQNGFRVLDLGRTDLDNSGLQSFKRS